MHYLLSIIPFTLLFAFITWRHFRLGLFFVFALLPVYLIRFSLGPLPTTLLEVMIWIVLGVWFIKYIAKKDTRHKPSSRAQAEGIQTNLKKQIINNKILWVGAVIFLIAATISIFTAADIRAAAGEWKAFYIEPFLLFIVLITTLKEKQGTRHKVQGTDAILFALVLLGLVTSALAIYQHFTGWMVPHAFWANRDTYRVTGWYGFPNGVGVFLAPIVPIAVYFVLRIWGVIKGRKHQDTNKYQETNNKKQKFENWKFMHWFLFGSCILFLLTGPLAIFYAKSTGGLLGILAGIGIYILASKKLRWPAIAVGLVGLVSIFMIPQLQPIETELTLQDRSGQIRIAMWDETRQLLTDNPVLGAGLGSYKHAVAPYHTRVGGEGIEIFHHPHNLFLTMWVNTGILGLVGFLLIIVWFYKTGIKHYKIQGSGYRTITLCLLATMTALLATGAADSPYIKNDLALFFWLLPALMIIVTGTKQKNR